MQSDWINYVDDVTQPDAPMESYEQWSLAAGNSSPGGNGFGDFATGFEQIAAGIGGILPSAFLFTPAGQSASKQQARAAAQAERRLAREQSRAAAAARADAKDGVAFNVGGAPLSALNIISGLAIAGVLFYVVSKVADGK